jgi:uncharacterized RDD family membrane protein YckC
VTQPVPPPGGTPAGPTGPRADFWYRLGGFLIDGVILYVIGVVIGLVFRGNLVSQILISLAAGIAYSVYFIGSGSGQTPGMRLLNIRAVDAVTGGRVDYGRAFIRYLVGIVSQLACYLGYFWMLWDQEKQTWHDKASKTYVVPTSAYPVERWPG